MGLIRGKLEKRTTSSFCSHTRVCEKYAGQLVSVEVTGSLSPSQGNEVIVLAVCSSPVWYVHGKSEDTVSERTRVDKQHTVPLWRRENT